MWRSGPLGRATLCNACGVRGNRLGTTSQRVLASGGSGDSVERRDLDWSGSEQRGPAGVVPPEEYSDGYGNGKPTPPSADAPLTETTMSAVHNATTGVAGGSRQHFKQFTKTLALNAGLVR